MRIVWLASQREMNEKKFSQNFSQPAEILAELGIVFIHCYLNTTRVCVLCFFLLQNCVCMAWRSFLSFLLPSPSARRSLQSCLCLYRAGMCSYSEEHFLGINYYYSTHWHMLSVEHHFSNVVCKKTP